MNNEKSVTRDISSGKERKPKRKKIFALIVTAIVLAVAIFLAFNLVQDGSVTKKVYAVDETLYDLLLKNEQLDQGDSDELRYRIFQGILEIDSTMAFIGSLGYEEDLDEIDTIINEQRQTFYEEFTEVQLKELKQTQVDNFGYTYDQYFEVMHTHTQRYTNALNWLERNPSENETTQRQVLDRFIKENQQVLTEFMEKKSIPNLAEQFRSRKFDGVVASVDKDQVLLVQELEPNEYVNLSEEETIAAAYESVWFNFNEPIDDIKPDTHIEITFDPLSYTITNQERPPRFHDVYEWNEFTQ